MISTTVLTFWYAHISRNLQGFEGGCVLKAEQQAADVFQAMIVSEGFDIDERVLRVAKSVATHRKSVVQKIASASVVNADTQSATASVSQISHNRFLVCAPVIIERQLEAVFCCVITQKRQHVNRDVVSDIETAISWLGSLAKAGLDQPRSDTDVVNQKNLQLAIEMCSIAITHDDAVRASTAVASHLASKLSCERVALGFIKDCDVRLFALSNHASYESSQNIIKRIEDAMQEAIDQQESILYPSPKESYQAVVAHRELSSHHDVAYICSVPVMLNDDIIGCMVFERGHGSHAFEPSEVELCEQLSSLLGPVIEYRRRDEQPLIQKARTALNNKFNTITGHDRHSKAIAILLVTAAIVAFSMLDSPYRIKANAVLEGAIERVVTAPEAGFIKEADVRPGDLISMGQTLATLDDRDLQLEKLKWSGKQQQISREFREALATSDRSKIGILRSQLDQAEAQLSILDKKLQRTRISAPIGGVIVSGDFTRALGSPVDKGQILYKLSPLDDYRIVLQVDESEISELAVGMKGELTLNAAVADTYEFTVNKITPVSKSEGGANTFQVEASLDTAPEFLRPGMQGVGKIDAGTRSIFWLWTHEMFDWIRLKLWSWF